MHRRQFLKLSTLGAAGLAFGPTFWRGAVATQALPGDGPYGPLLAPDANGLRLPAGFTSRVIGVSEQPVAGTSYLWHHAPDGGACFPVSDGGWIYVSNSEIPLHGGAGAIRFTADGAIADAYRVLEGTNLNCGGGPTPWGTWLSGEEHEAGLVWECDPLGKAPQLPRPALGVFKHEAAIVDPVHGQVFLTEDQPDGRFYRFTPTNPPLPGGRLDLSAGVLEAAAIVGGSGVAWHPVPNPTLPVPTPTRHQAPASTAFAGGEGIFYDSGIVYFTTKGDNRVWAYDTNASTIEVIYDDNIVGAPLKGVDNITVSSAGDLYVAEDGDDMQICVITPGPERVVAPVLQVVGHPGSEITGPAFDPSGTRLYFSSQRGENTTPYMSPGYTYEVTGPFRTA